MAHYTPTVQVGANETCKVTAGEDKQDALTITPDGGSAGTTLVADGSGQLPGFTYAAGGEVFIATSVGMHRQEPDADVSGPPAYKHQAGITAGVQVVTGGGKLTNVEVNTGAASAAVTVHDSATVGGIGAGTQIAVIDGTAARNQEFDTEYTKGLVLVVAGGAADVTVTYDPN